MLYVNQSVQILYFLYFTEVAEDIDSESRDKDEGKTGENGTVVTADPSTIEENLPENLEPLKPPKLRDLNFFASASPEPPSKQGKRKRQKVHSSKLSKTVKIPDSDSSSESSSESVDNSEATMREIFEAYDPLSAAETIGSSGRVSAKKRLKRTVHGDLDYIADNVVETVGAGSLKKRIAHNQIAEVISYVVFIVF